MDRDEGKKRLALLKKYDLAYHSEGESLVSDAKYDKLKKDLQKAFPKLSYFKEVGAPIIGKKVALPIELGGFNQLRPKEVDKWVQRIKKKYGADTLFFVLPKLDGISCLLEYTKRNGVFELTAAYTRGRIKPGETEQKGKPVLQHVKMVQGARSKLSGPYISKVKDKKIYIRGELVCHNSLFEKVKGQPLPHKPEGYTNPRGFVSGVFNRDDISSEQYKKLMSYITFVAFGAIHGKTSIDKHKQLTLLSEWGFSTVINPSRVNRKYLKFLKAHGQKPKRLLDHNPANGIVLDTSSISENYLIDILNKNIETLDISQDGLVIEVSNQNIRSELGNEGNFPDYAVKVKPEREQQETKIGVLGKIEWGFTSRRIYKPVAILKEPIDFNGIKFSRASLHNAGNVRDMNLEIGCKVKCVRAGQVIPHIVGRV